jgi:Ca2+-binding EF-hand superfamily protein
MMIRILIPAIGLLLASGTALAWPHGKADTDGDGAISREEFMRMHEKKFDKLDADGDGQISVEERKAAREKFKEHRKERMKGHKTE